MTDAKWLKAVLIVLNLCLIIYIPFKALTWLLEEIWWLPQTQGEKLSPDWNQKVVLVREASDPTDWVQYSYKLVPVNPFKKVIELGSCTSHTDDRHHLGNWIDNQHFWVRVEPGYSEPTVTRHLIDIRSPNWLLDCDNYW